MSFGKYGASFCTRDGLWYLSFGGDDGESSGTVLVCMMLGLYLFKVVLLWSFGPFFSLRSLVGPFKPTTQARCLTRLVFAKVNLYPRQIGRCKPAQRYLADSSRTRAAVKFTSISRTPSVSSIEQYATSQPTPNVMGTVATGS